MYKTPHQNRLTAKEFIKSFHAGQRDFKGVDLSRIQLKNQDFSGVSLEEAILIKAEFRYVNLTGANFKNADLSLANLTGSTLNKANLQGADLTLTRMNGVSLSEANIQGAVFLNVKTSYILSFPQNQQARDFEVQKDEVLTSAYELIQYLRFILYTACDIKPIPEALIPITVTSNLMQIRLNRAQHLTALLGEGNEVLSQLEKDFLFCDDNPVKAKNLAKQIDTLKEKLKIFENELQEIANKLSAEG